jgi:hypothetical protein
MPLAIVLAITAVILALAVSGGIYLRRRIGRTPERERLCEINRDLGWTDRWRVYRAVGKGRAVKDPALASAAVARAQYRRAYGRRVMGSRWRWACAVIGGLELLLAGARLSTPGTGPLLRVVGAAPALVLAAVLLSIPWSIPWMWRFSGRRLERAEQLNRALLPSTHPYG